MAHVFLPDGRGLRLRLFPKPKPAQPRKKAPPTSLALFDPPSDDDTAATPAERLAVRVAELCLINRINTAILNRMPTLGLRDWWLASGCLFQTVWNLRSGRPAERGILDYDVCYFSEDLSWEAEDDVIRAAAKLFADLPVNIQLRNQARVHLWFPEKFGAAYPPLTSASEGVLRFPLLTPGHWPQADRRNLHRRLRALWPRRRLGHRRPAKSGSAAGAGLCCKNCTLAKRMG